MHTAVDPKVESKLVEISNLLYKTGVTVSNFEENSNEVLHRRLNKIMDCLVDLNQLKEQIDIDVPLNILEVVESGVNPDLVRKDQIQTLVDKNQKTKGRLEALKMFKNDLTAQIELNYPELKPELEKL
ncbi:Mediator of RNA polymerase II transcription subunit 10 [Boothiomyces sp. JEL0866]|nr:Mediator of RNA polymerase II transcription subunit 10 [Boothiomyces sp. JEL0866]